MCINNLYRIPLSDGRPWGTLMVGDLLHPLSYAINSSFMAVFCDLNLQKEYGHLLDQYKHSTIFKSGPLLLDIPQLPGTQIIATALAPTICEAPDRPDEPELADPQPVSGSGMHESRTLSVAAEALVNDVVVVSSDEAFVGGSRTHKPTVALLKPIVDDPKVETLYCPSATNTKDSDQTSSDVEQEQFNLTALVNQDCVVVKGPGSVHAPRSSDLSVNSGMVSVSDGTWLEANTFGNTDGDEHMQVDNEQGSSLAPNPDPTNLPPELDSTTEPKRSARLNAMFNLNGSKAKGAAPDRSGSKKQAQRSHSKHPRVVNGVQKQPERSTKRKNPSQIRHPRPKKTQHWLKLRLSLPKNLTSVFQCGGIDLMERGVTLIFDSMKIWQLPTKWPGANEPNLYVLTNSEQQALSRLERDMTAGELDASVEDCVSILHRLDDEIEVQGVTQPLPNYMAYK
ncbi:hypothetical protein DFH08DRAFT_808624 [Mycena albidolilacea]|uniref:Uncharacterized protein n=1 Tax=Mycena albidolilacea TaxID=1033008 RepID=A0AAD7A2X2_9AGAR|nr:hypothetical protein DFH08DRAFT_808624 [Mycena albidolilacea]